LCTRDIKPNNIKILPNGQLKLLDFGLAKSSWQELSQAAGGSSILGHTPGYAAPEQVAGKSTPLSDLYAVGATLYVLLSNQVPVDAISRSSDVAGRQPDPLRSLQELAPQVPRHVANGIMSSLALAAPDRPASAQAFAQQLQLGQAAIAHPVPAAAVKTTRAPVAPPVLSQPSQPRESAQLAQSEPRESAQLTQSEPSEPKRWGWWVGAVSGLVLLGLGGWVMWPRPAPVATPTLPVAPVEQASYTPRPTYTLPPSETPSVTPSWTPLPPDTPYPTYTLPPSATFTPRQHADSDEYGYANAKADGNGDIRARQPANARERRDGTGLCTGWVL
jgi:serine/threonine protein kinase